MEARLSADRARRGLRDRERLRQTVPATPENQSGDSERR